MFAIARRYTFLGFLIVSSLVALPAVSPQPAAPARLSASQPSLGDYARGLREKKRVKVKVTPEEAQQLFKAVDEITDFASKRSGLAQNSKVKRQRVGQSEVERQMREQTF